jgi:hypothetical protein
MAATVRIIIRDVDNLSFQLENEEAVRNFLFDLQSPRPFIVIERPSAPKKVVNKQHIIKVEII